MRNLIVTVLFFTVCLCNGQNVGVDFTKISATIEPMGTKEEIRGEARYTFTMQDALDSIFIDAKNINVIEFRLNGRKRVFKNNGKQLGFKTPRKLGEHEILLKYVARPKQTVYFFGFDKKVHKDTLSVKAAIPVLPIRKQIWTQGQGKYTSHWLPSFDDMNEKVEFDLQILADPSNTVVANGLLVNTDFKNGKKVWQFDMQKPMSSYLLAFAIGDYEKHEIKSNTGISIENYYYPEDKLKVEPTYRYTKEIFDFLENEIGVAYPWQNYKQVPVHDFLYAGMENTSVTIFSDAFMINDTSFVDKNYVNVNAHEMAHQWFGNLVTEKNSSNHWLQEGFATYYAYLAEKLIFGEDDFYWKLNKTATILKQRSDSGKGQSLLDPNSDSLTFYEKGAWALVMLKEELGEANFKKGIINYLTKYSYKNVNVENFLNEMELASGRNLDLFKKEWLESSTFPWDKTSNYLRKYCKSIVQYDAIRAAINSTKNYYKDSIMTSFWSHTKSSNIKKQFVLDYNDKISDKKLANLLNNEAIGPRQNLAVTRDPIYIFLKPLFESMLNDESYVTIENALYKLWTEFPENRIKYLNATKDIFGLPSKNVRTLWLALAIVTPNYNLVKKQTYLKELREYTSPAYNPELRKSAFQYLSELKVLEDSALVNLIKATNHHSWQFRNFARSLLDEQLNDDEQIKKIDSVALLMDIKDLQYLKKKLEQ